MAQDEEHKEEERLTLELAAKKKDQEERRAEAEARQIERLASEVPCRTLLSPCRT